MSEAIFPHVPHAQGIYRPALLPQWRSQGLRVGILLTMIVILNAVDLAYTLFAYRINMLGEMNPVAESFLREGLTQSLICYKTLMVLCGSVMLWRVRESRWAVAGCWVLVLAYAGLGVVWYLWVKDVTMTMEARMAMAEPIRQLMHH